VLCGGGVQGSVATATPVPLEFSDVDLPPRI
jgi:hypothetical protein